MASELDKAQALYIKATCRAICIQLESAADTSCLAFDELTRMAQEPTAIEEVAESFNITVNEAIQSILRECHEMEKAMDHVINQEDP